MAIKLKPLLDKLLSHHQTGFLKGRSILHGFHYAQQVVQSAKQQRACIALFKADIFKAFDTLSWQFLMASLKARGFPQTWLYCVQNKVLEGSSRIILNSIAGKSIKLRRGVRQGDPLSPYLFNLAIDLLPRWIQRLHDHNFLSPPFPQCSTCLLYADDALLFLQPTRNQMIRAKLLFQLFGQITGLHLNPQKSELAITSSALSMVQNLAAVMQCEPKQFPVKYLGLPLSDKRLAKADYLSIVDKVQHSLAGWKAPLLSVGGRLILTNSVLSAIPVYFMSVFLLPKWALKRIDKIRKNFLWHGHINQQPQARRLYMVSWALATRPRRIGGLGVRQIETTNHALLMKWLWEWYKNRNAWWTKITQLPSPSDKPWQAANASPFWKNLARIALAFHSSIRFQVHNGETTQFWHDNWQGTPLNLLLPALYSLMQNKFNSVAQCVHDTTWLSQTSSLTPPIQADFDQLLIYLHHTQLTQQEDEVTWIRTSHGFSVRSAYKFMTLSPSPDSPLKHVWEIKAPLRVSIFSWLLLSNRLTTADNLARRGWNLPSMCAMCKRAEESIAHLFHHCAVAKEVRSYIHTVFAHRYHISSRFSTNTSMETITNSLENMPTRQWELSTCFVIWRERCRRIFSDKHIPLKSIVREIYTEQKAWFLQPIV